VRQRPRSHRTYATRVMRIKRRSALVLALATAGALAAAGLAFANHTSNVSSLPTFKFAPATAPKTTFVNGGLTVRWHINYAHPSNRALGGSTKTVTLLFDNDFQFNLTGIPACTANFGYSTTIAQAWERCGPGADTSPEVNAYLSPPTAVSGRASTAPPPNYDICVLAFKKSATQILLFGRITNIVNGTADCSTPATNTKGSNSGTLTGTLSNLDAPDLGTKLTFPEVIPIPLALDDVSFTLRRGGLVKGRCFDTNKIWNLRGIFAYTDDPDEPTPPQPTDTVNKTQTCAVG
jgi:hypothetical protein